jgi:hypothetical protein
MDFGGLYDVNLKIFSARCDVRQFSWCRVDKENRGSASGFPPTLPMILGVGEDGRKGGRGIGATYNKIGELEVMTIVGLGAFIEFLGGGVELEHHVMRFNRLSRVHFSLHLERILDSNL